MLWYFCFCALVAVFVMTNAFAMKAYFKREGYVMCNTEEEKTLARVKTALAIITPGLNVIFLLSAISCMFFIGYEDCMYKMIDDGTLKEIDD